MKRVPMSPRKAPMPRGKELERKTRIKPVSDKRVAAESGAADGLPGAAQPVTLARKAASAAVQRYVGIRPRSAKTEKVYREERRPLVAQLLEERPACQRCDRARSTEVHEPGLRSRGADITDPDECVALCHTCHRWIHDNPALATAEGWMRPSWTPPEGVA